MTARDGRTLSNRTSAGCWGSAWIGTNTVERYLTLVTKFEHMYALRPHGFPPAGYFILQKCECIATSTQARAFHKQKLDTTQTSTSRKMDKYAIACPMTDSRCLPMGGGGWSLDLQRSPISMRPVLPLWPISGSPHEINQLAKFRNNPLLLGCTGRFQHTTELIHMLEHWTVIKMNGP